MLVSAFGQGLKRRVAVSVMVLTIVSLVIFTAIVTMFMRLQASEARTADGIRENAVWTAYQADREAGRLVEFIMRFQSDHSKRAFDEVMRRYDVLYSRGEIIEEAHFSFDIARGAAVGDASRAVQEAIKNLAPLVDKMLATPGERVSSMPVLLERADEIRQLTEALVLKANATNSSFRVEERAFVLGTYSTIAIGVLTLTFALIAVVVLLINQIVHISRTGRQLEELSERNARAAEAAEAGTRAKSAFLASMSHEIRTPLNGIIGMAEVLAETRLSDDQREQIQVIRQSGDLLLEVINDVLDFSKVESGAIDIHEVEFNLPGLLASIEVVMAPRALAKGLSLTFAGQSLSITTDPSRLRQILVNLVGNAIKFTETGLVTVKAFAETGGRMRFEVSDTGIGIAESMQSKLFKEFSQVDGSITRRFGGTGLGLAISKRMIEAMGGVVGVRSQLNKGSLFWFCLPVGEVKPIQEKPTVNETLPVFRGSILVVEDNTVNQQVVTRLLNRMGFIVECVSNGAEALEELSVRRFDLVFMDMQMPVLDGLAATRALRARGDTIPIVGLTANAFVSDRDSCLEAGMDGFMSKPVTRSKLATALGPWFNPMVGSETPPPAVQGDPAEVTVTQIDEGYRAALIAEIGADLVASLIEDFVTDALAQLEGAHGAFVAGNLESCDRYLHTLKGAAQSLGFTEIGSLAQSGREMEPLEQGWFDHLERLIHAVAMRDSGPLAA